MILRTLSIVEFFSKESIEELLLLIDYQIQYQKYYKILSPEQLYLKAFLLVKQGNVDEAIKIIADTYIYQKASEDNKNKLIKKITESSDK